MVIFSFSQDQLYAAVNYQNQFSVVASFNFLDLQQYYGLQNSTYYYYMAYQTQLFLMGDRLISCIIFTIFVWFYWSLVDFQWNIHIYEY